MTQDVSPELIVVDERGQLDLRSTTMSGLALLGKGKDLDPVQAAMAEDLSQKFIMSSGPVDPDKITRRSMPLSLADTSLAVAALNAVSVAYDKQIESRKESIATTSDDRRKSANIVEQLSLAIKKLKAIAG